MSFSKRQFMHTVWIAIFAMLMAALAPSVSHFVAVSHHMDHDAATCHVEPTSGGHEPIHRAAALLVDCEYCTMQADLPLLPQQPHRIDGPLLMVRFLPPLFLHAPAPMFVWLAANPRAPPMA